MRSYGLKPSEVQGIKKLLQDHFGDLVDVKAYLFGSRSKGTQKPFSDIDIAIKSRSRDISRRIALFQESWEKSKLPYKVDITPWKDIYKPYLPEIRKTKTDFWRPADKELHPWRACPYGQHWVIRHPRYPVGRQLQDVDSHCRKNPLGKDRLDGDEIDFISKLAEFQSTNPLPKAYVGQAQIKYANDYDILIAGWCRYWNEVMKPDIPIEANFIKALMESESHFNPLAQAQNKKGIGPARGLIQITEQSWKILKDRKGEIKDHYVDLKKEELFEPSKNICAAIRWLFRKREILQRRLSRPPTWVETLVEYKGIGPDLKKMGPRSVDVMENFLAIYRKYQ